MITEKKERNHTHAHTHTRLNRSPCTDRRVKNAVSKNGRKRTAFRRETLCLLLGKSAIRVKHSSAASRRRLAFGRLCCIVVHIMM